MRLHWFVVRSGDDCVQKCRGVEGPRLPFLPKRPSSGVLLRDPHGPALPGAGREGDGLKSMPLIQALAASFALGFTLLNLPPVLGELMSLYGITHAGISLLISALLWTHALVQIPAGMFVDRLGLRASLLLSLGCMSIGNLLPILAPSLPLAIAGRVIAGIGTGSIFVAVMKLAATLGAGTRGGAYQGYCGAVTSLGSIVAYLVLPFLIAHGWQWTYLSSGLISTSTLMMMPFSRLHETRPSVPSVRPISLSGMALIPIAWVIGGYHALSHGSRLQLGTWVPALMCERWESSSALCLAMGGALVMLVGALGRGLGGLILGKVAPVTIANGSIFLMGVLFLGLSLIHLPGLTLLLSLLSAWFSSVTFGSFFYLASRSVPPHSMASVLGFVNFLANLGAILLTLAFGWFRDLTGSFAGGFGLIAALSFVAFLAGRRWIREIHRPPS
jgi:nitrate/nitrite transporter NarK